MFNVVALNTTTSSAHSSFASQTVSLQDAEDYVFETESEDKYKLYQQSHAKAR